MQYGRSQIFLSLLAVGLIGSAVVFLLRQDSESATERETETALQAVAVLEDHRVALVGAHQGYVDAAQELAEMAKELSLLAQKVSERPGAEDLEALGEMNQSFSLQYLQLQQNMQAQNREFNLLSNIMKTKHDTAKNAINNVR